MYYNYDRINSYNATWNFILTNRGYGKTYGMKKYCIKRFIKTGKQFMYVRRYKTELKKDELLKFFDAIKKEFPNNEFKVVGKTFYIDDRVAGFAVPLSVSQNFKSVEYPNVETIFYDEFIIDKGKGKGYITNEVDVALDLYETVARTRSGVKMYFLANNISIVNPYFTYFNVKINKNERFTLCRDGELIIDISTNDEFIQMKKETKFGKLIRGTKYSDYAIDNKSLRDNDAFVEKLPLKYCDEFYSINYKDKTYMLWLNLVQNIIYVNMKPTKTCPNYSILSTDHCDGALLNTKFLSNALFNQTIRYFQFGKLRFENMEVKYAMYEIFRELGVK